jgi:hypothetical protein
MNPTVLLFCNCKQVLLLLSSSNNNSSSSSSNNSSSSSNSNSSSSSSSSSNNGVLHRRWSENVALKGDRIGAYRSLVGRPEGKRQLGRHRRRWRDKIKIDLQDAGWRNMDWADLAKGRDRWPVLLDAVMNLWVP